MEEVPVGDSSLAHQCLAFCQTLASQGRTFSLSLTAGSSFIFSMESNEISVPVQVVKKKSSPSTLRRNAKRRELFLKRKLASSVEMKAPSEYAPSASTVVCPPQLSSVIRVEGRPFQCDLCTASFVSKHGLKYHTESTHTMQSSSKNAPFPHPSPAIQHTAPNILPCDQCTSSFSTQTSLKIHIEDCHTQGNITYKSGMLFQHLIPDNWG